MRGKSFLITVCVWGGRGRDGHSFNLPTQAILLSLCVFIAEDKLQCFIQEAENDALVCENPDPCVRRFRMLMPSPSQTFLHVLFSIL